MTFIKTSQEITAIRRAGQIVGSVLFDLAALVRPGMTGLELNATAQRLVAIRGGQPAFYGYNNFPAHICVSVNDAVVHGIPDDQPFKPGDVVGIDAGAVVDGYYADGAITLAVPPIHPKTQRLLAVTEAARAAGIRRATAGRHLGDVQAAIQATIETAGMGIIRELTGHGIGRQLHEPPEIANYGRVGEGPILRPGMTICLEPMVTLGAPDVFLDSDHWTIRTQDHSLGAQFEHTILITEAEPEILTLVRPWPEG